MSQLQDDTLQRTESYQYPAAHVGHLKQEQASQLEEFKHICQQKGYYTPATSSAPASHDDETLLRYLRARKFVPTDAFGQFQDTEDWRKENQIDKLYENIDVQEYDAARRLYPQWTGRRDRRGIPVYVFEVAHLNSKAVSAYESSTSKPQGVMSKVPPKMLRLFALYENLTTFALPLCSAIPDRQYPETPVSQSNNIVDISKVGLKQFWNLKSHMQDASTLATAHYPETLDRIFIIGAPSFFPTVWGWIKRWFDPITVSKIFILSSSTMKSTLEQYIAPENIPKKYGGKLDYEFGQLPNLEPAISDSLKWESPETARGKSTFPTGPIRWETKSDGSHVAMAVGSEHGKPRHRVIATMSAPTTQSAKQTLLSAKERERGGGRQPLVRTTTGVDTHPPSPPPGTVDETEPRDEPRGSTDSRFGTEEADVPRASGAGSYTVPFRSAAAAGLMPAVGSGHIQNTSDTIRQGTTSTRYIAQDATHARGEQAEGTPTMRDNGEGDKHGVMEPNTVGQAPKVHPVPEPEQPAPSYLDQAKGLAGQAYGAALNVVGMNKEGESEQAEHGVEHGAEKSVPEDPAVDGAKQRNVEEFLRSQYQTAKRS